MPNTSDKKALNLVRISVDRSEADLLEEMIATLSLEYAVDTDVDKSETMASVFCDSEKEAKTTSKVIQQALDDCWYSFFDKLPRVEIATLANEDWAEVWKENFGVIKVSDRLVVKPSWCDYERVSDEYVIELDPGMSFGTGHHGTTLACLKFLDYLNPTHQSLSFLDVGCGSGILTLAAAQLGYCSLTAFDNDPQAIIAAEENLTNADIRQSVHLFESDLQTAPALETFDVVIANILAHILREHTAYICDRIKRSGGHLIIAGILEEQYTETLAAFQKTEPALKEIKRESIDGWASGLLRLTAENSEQNTVG